MEKEDGATNSTPSRACEAAWAKRPLLMDVKLSNYLNI
jgi:hypothetical protein